MDPQPFRIDVADETLDDLRQRLARARLRPDAPRRPASGMTAGYLAGIGLVDVTIEVHVAQRGVLSRVIAAAEAGLIAGALGIDERTALIVGEGGLRVEGSGNVWRVPPTDSGALVSTIGPAD